MEAMTSARQHDSDLDARMVRALIRSTTPERRSPSMNGSSERFFTDLDRRGYEPSLEHLDAAVQFELDHADGVDHWWVRVEHGHVRVSREESGAACVIRASRALLDEMSEGRANALAALLRGELLVDGDPEALVLFQRVFAGPVEGAGHE
jgi:hypothetical protein